MWKHHVVYESRPHSIIITLEKRLYRIPGVVPKDCVSMILTKQYSKVILQTDKFILFMIHSQNEKKIVATSMTSAQGPSTLLLLQLR